MSSRRGSYPVFLLCLWKIMINCLTWFGIAEKLRLETLFSSESSSSWSQNIPLSPPRLTGRWIQRGNLPGVRSSLRSSFSTSASPPFDLEVPTLSAPTPCIWESYQPSMLCFKRSGNWLKLIKGGWGNHFWFISGSLTQGCIFFVIPIYSYLCIKTAILADCIINWAHFIKNSAVTSLVLNQSQWKMHVTNRLNPNKNRYTNRKDRFWYNWCAFESFTFFSDAKPNQTGFK